MEERSLPEDALGFCRTLHPRLVGAMVLQTGDPHLAEELAQDCLVRVLDRWSTVAAMERPEAWAFRVAYNLASSRFRRRSAEHRANRRSRAGHEAVELPDVAWAVTIRSAVAELPTRQRAAVICRYFADLTVADTATVLGCREGTVKSLTSQAIAALRGQLNDSSLEEEVDRV